MKKSFVRGTWQVKRAFSPCVITEGGGRTIYVAGHTDWTIAFLFVSGIMLLSGIIWLAGMKFLSPDTLRVEREAPV